MSKNKSSDSRGLNIIVVGCGKVGVTLIDQLSKEGHNITIIDNNFSKIQHLSNLYDVMGVCGNGATLSIQQDAGVETADLFIAVTGSDELNLLCCTVAMSVKDIATIARVRTPDYSEEAEKLRAKLGLDMIINPELESAREAARILYLPTVLEVNKFAHNNVEMVKFKIPEGNKLDGMTLIQLNRSISSDVLVCGVDRDGAIHIPSGQFILRAGDKISIVAKRKSAREFLYKIGFDTHQVKDAMIIGGGKSAYYLALQLIRAGIEVKIIEQDKARCEELSSLLPKATIINGDGTDEDILREEGIEDVQSFVPLTGIDEENVMLTLFARQNSQAKVITKVNRLTFRSVIDSLDLGSLIYPSFITSEAIIRYVRAKKDSMESNIETLYHIFSQRAEAIEFRVHKDCPLIGKPLMDLKLKNELLLACITRGESVLIPRGQDVLKAGDSVVVVTVHTGFTDIEDILA
ncbi:MAG: Trk system potassium transporter TrkA [Lachnospiraceae bacterium]|nr:Trk system potassium transporter TrkA [Lachnospiraceae bacterium]